MDSLRQWCSIVDHISKLIFHSLLRSIDLTKLPRRCFAYNAHRRMESWTLCYSINVVIYLHANQEVANIILDSGVASLCELEKQAIPLTSSCFDLLVLA